MKFMKSTAFRLIVSIFVGIAVGYGVLALPAGWEALPLQALIIGKQVTSSVIFFMVPLIICGCVAPAITGFRGNVAKLLIFTIGLAYASSILAAFMSMGLGYWLVPAFHIDSAASAAPLPLPKAILALEFPTMNTMSALLLSLLIGLGAVWIKSDIFIRALADFQKLVLTVVKRVLVPLLPVFIGCNFALLAYQGQLGRLSIFLPAVAVVISAQWAWIVLLYVAARLYSGKNSWQVGRYYGPAYFTAVGTMSSAATLPVALECIFRSPVVRKDTSEFAVPLYSNIHLCGSVITEVFLVVTTYYMMFHQLPEVLPMCVFIALACLIAIGSPGIPGGINVSCSTLVLTLILAGHGAEWEQFFAIMTAIYSLQDGFGTACNVTCDGALTLITDTYISRTSANK